MLSRPFDSPLWWPFLLSFSLSLKSLVSEASAKAKKWNSNAKYQTRAWKRRWWRGWRAASARDPAKGPLQERNWKNFGKSRPGFERPLSTGELIASKNRWLLSCTRLACSVVPESRWEGRCDLWPEGHSVLLLWLCLRCLPRPRQGLKGRFNAPSATESIRQLLYARTQQCTC